MSAMTILGLVVLGVLIGALSGMVGIGGGILIIPALMILFKFSQPMANGTSLAMMLPPIGIFAVIAYYRAGNVNVPYAFWLACGFIAGAYIGAKLINSGKIHPTALRVAFACLLLYVCFRILFRPGGEARAAIQVTILIFAFIGTWLFFKLLGRHHYREATPDWGAIYRSKVKHGPPIGMDYEI